MRGGAVVAREPHLLKVVGSIPTCATNLPSDTLGCSRGTTGSGRFTRWVARCLVSPTNRQFPAVRPVCNTDLDEFVPLAQAGGLARLNPHLLKA